MSADPFTSCEAIVRKADYDRYLAALFAPAPVRPHLFALYAFNHEVAKTAESVSQPVMGQIRLQWWRDAIDELYAGKMRHHEVVQALAAAVLAHGLPRMLFDELIDARESDLDEAPFAQLISLEAYADATSGHVMRLAARILGAGDRFDRPAGEAGIAYALTGVMRALPYHAARRRLTIPTDALAAVGLSPEQVFAGQAGPLGGVLVELAGDARRHLEAARAFHGPRRVLSALLPAALVPLYLALLTRPGFDPFREAAEVPVYRRQLAMLKAVMLGNL